MTCELHNVARLRGWVEGTFATDGTGTLANYTDIPAIEGSVVFTGKPTMLDPEYLQQHVDGYPEQQIGPETTTLSFSMNLAPSGAEAGDAVAAQQSALGMILATVMGGENLGTGDTVQAGSPSATVFDVSAAAARNLTDGAAVGLLTGASSALEAREIQQQSTNELTLKLALTAAPNATDVVYAAATYYPDQNPLGSMQFIIEGAEQDDRWLALGMQLESIAITTPLNQLPRVTFNFKGPKYLHGDDTAGVLTGSALGTASYTLVQPIHADGEFRFPTVGVDTLAGTAIDISDLTINMQLGYLDVPSPQGTEGIAKYRRNRGRPLASGSFTTFYEDEQRWDDRDAKTKKAIFFQMGNAAGSTMLLSFPRTQIQDVARIDAGGLAGTRVDWATMLDADTTADNDQANAAVRFHLL